MSMVPILDSLMNAVTDFFHSPRIVTATAAGVIATAATVIQNVSAIAGYESLAVRTREEKERIEGTLTLLAKLHELNTPEALAACKELEKDLKVSVDRLTRLTETSCEVRADPNHDLSLPQRLFIAFEPAGYRATVIHVLTYLFMAVLAILVLAGHYLSKSFSPENYADLLVLTGYCALAFRSWALSERRWRLGHNPVTGFRRTLFILRAPVNNAMLVAQTFFWASIFCVAEGIEDILLDLGNGKHPTTIESCLKLGAPLVAAALSRCWAYAEVKSSLQRLPLRSVLQWNSSSPSWWVLLACIAELILSVASLFFSRPVFSEPLHRMLFVLEAAISCVAAFEWFAVSTRSRLPAPPNESVRSTSAGA